MVEKSGVATGNYIRWLYELNKDSGPIAGGKGAKLAERFNAMFPVPPAFVITTKAYWRLVEPIKNKINEVLDVLDVDDTAELEAKAKEIRETIIKLEVPQDLKDEIEEAYDDLGIDKEVLSYAKSDALKILSNSHEPIFVAVRSSATTEDLDDSSFAGQQESYLNVKGTRDLLEKIKRVFASLFTARAIYYRKKRGFSKEKFALAVVVQKMVDADTSGVMFSSNPISKNDNVVLEAVYGLGEGIVSGKIKPDSYEITRELEITSKKIASKKIALVRNSRGEIEEIKLKESISKAPALEDREVKQLSNYALKIEEYYGKPQDIEFAIERGEIYIVQSRPVTTTFVENKGGEIKGKELLSGLGASPGVSSGKVRIINDLNELSKVRKGDVLVTKMTNPDMVITMQKSSAIVTDEGGLTSHAAIVSREMGIPAVVGTDEATTKLRDGEIVTVDGFAGKVYEGEGETVVVEIKPVVPTKVKIKVLADLPEAVERAAKTGVDAVGLLRLEGIIASSGKHPMKFMKENNLQEYVKILVDGISKISAPFKEIWIRTSDIRSDEFSNLPGSLEIEANPMLGNHGIRFSLKNPEILKAEFEAIKICSEKFSDKVYGIILPQVISESDVVESKKIALESGLKNVKIGIMVETPAACLIIKNLLKIGVDFISFGTNDLTQYILAIDRGNEDVQDLFSETHPAVLNAIKRVLRTCEEMGVESSICGQAGSNKEMVKFLIENGIKSISVNADAAYEISKFVAEIEGGVSKDVKEASSFEEIRNPEQIIQEIDKKVESEMTNQITEMIQDKKEQENVEVNDGVPTYVAPIIEKKIDEPISPEPAPEPMPSPEPEDIPEPNQEADIEDYGPYENNLLQEQIEGNPSKKINFKVDEKEDDKPSVLKEINEDDLDELLDVF